MVWAIRSMAVALGGFGAMYPLVAPVTCWYQYPPLVPRANVGDV